MAHAWGGGLRGIAPVKKLSAPNAQKAQPVAVCGQLMGNSSPFQSNKSARTKEQLTCLRKPIKAGPAEKTISIGIRQGDLAVGNPGRYLLWLWMGPDVKPRGQRALGNFALREHPKLAKFEDRPSVRKGESR